jgi:hypothetical protein
VTDDDLRELLTDAVADVEPAYRLDAIKARTRPGHRRRGWYTAGGAILAAAAVVTAVSVVNDDRPRREPPASKGDQLMALYFVGDTPAGPRLYREYQRVSGRPVAALHAITTVRGPDDPDYSSTWPAESFESLTISGRAIEVELGPGAPRLGRLTPTEIQQVVYTAQAALGEQLPVAFTENGESVDGMLHDRDPQNEILAHVSINDPEEGLRVSGSFVARGRANSFESNVPWEIRDEADAVVLSGYTTAEGYGDHLFPWETDPIDISDLASGRYTFVAMTDDPSGGEGRGPFTDTRTIIVD